MAQETGFPTGVLADIYGFHPYTGNSVSLCYTQAQQYRKQPHG